MFGAYLSLWLLWSKNWGAWWRQRVRRCFQCQHAVAAWWWWWQRCTVWTEIMALKLLTTTPRIIKGEGGKFLSEVVDYSARAFAVFWEVQPLHPDCLFPFFSPVASQLPFCPPPLSTSLGRPPPDATSGMTRSFSYLPPRFALHLWRCDNLMLDRATIRKLPPVYDSEDSREARIRVPMPFATWICVPHIWSFRHWLKAHIVFTRERSRLRLLLLNTLENDFRLRKQLPLLAGIAPLEFALFLHDWAGWPAAQWIALWILPPVVDGSKVKMNSNPSGGPHMSFISWNPIPKRRYGLSAVTNDNLFDAEGSCSEIDSTLTGAWEGKG